MKYVRIFFGKSFNSNFNNFLKLKTNNMKKILILFITFFFIQQLSNAQCPPYPAAQGCGLAVPNCAGIDGYCNTLIPQTQNPEPLPDCGGTAVLNNDDWIAFYAGTETISIQIIPTNCQGAVASLGIQGGIYAACDAGGGVNEDGLASNSLMIQCGCTTAPIIFSASNFIVGQIYYLVVDGCGGDICDYEIEVLEGTTSNMEIIGPTGDIQGDVTHCAGDIAVYSIDSIENATYYNWTIDGTSSIINGQGTTEITVVVEEESSIEICVTPTNGCSTGAESCFTFIIEGVANIDTLFESFCFGDSIEFEGNIYCESGFYSTIYTNEEGCDSILNLNLMVYPIYDITINENLPLGGGEYNGIFYDSDTTLMEEHTTIFGCDSLVTINITLSELCPFPPAQGCGLTVPCCEGIDGYSGTLLTQTQITEPFPDCGGTSVLNNDDWLAFFASTTTITILITPSNCEGPGPNIGIHAGIYSDCDIDGGVNGDGLASSSMMVECGCTTAPITLSASNFEIGQIYYLVIDGCGGDICDYEIDVLEGSTAGLDILDQTGDIQGEITFCAGDIAIFNIDSVENATFYSWSINSNASIINGQGTTEIEVAIEEEGSFEICVSPTNGCSAGTESCIMINSMGIAQNTTLVESFCEGDSIEFEGIFYSESGFYSVIYTNEAGCDSILNLDLTVGEIYEISIDTTVCDVTSFEFGDSVYTENGSYQYLYSSIIGCDSMVYLDLTFGSHSQTYLDISICENENDNNLGHRNHSPRNNRPTLFKVSMVVIVWLLSM